MFKFKKFVTQNFFIIIFFSCKCKSILYKQIELKKFLTKELFQEK